MKKEKCVHKWTKRSGCRTAECLKCGMSFEYLTGYRQALKDVLKIILSKNRKGAVHVQKMEY